MRLSGRGGDLKIIRSLKKEHMNPETVDDILSKELQQLSFVTRTEINEEVHGVLCLSPEETPELLQESLQQLHQELSVLRQSGKACAYEQACQHAHSYVHASDFRLRFLRAELHDPIKAAVRMSLFLDLLLEFFGSNVLERPLRITDLTKQEMDILREGDLQPLPFRDRSGRRVIVTVNQFTMQYPIDARLKASLYLHWALSGDLESQRKGFVAIMCWSSKSTPFPPSLPGPGDKAFSNSSKLFSAFPWRMCSLHMCFPDKPFFHLLRSGIFLVLGENRSRIRMHIGDSIEIQYNLSGYGIPSDQLPVTESGNVKTKNARQWLRIRRALESAEIAGDDYELMALNLIECPGSKDVVFRCGQAYLSHPGNVMFRGLIEAMFQEHNNALSSESKVNITWQIIEEVEHIGGRFLVWDDGWWKVMTEKQQIRSKVAIAFKDHKRRVKAMSNCQVTQSSTLKFQQQDGRKRKRSVDVENDATACTRFFCM
ncbi:hypothetical protein IV203_034090 [Nitzschia inconspicua]|uniref:DUF6824 domain-containing protein n=1 Tax=Nitzschia inconspicua TaxID=303405 RepID=A0A9K3M749_9STRA|nr:hypothetical protein IV203_034090 [Nitzschia inconspicua]